METYIEARRKINEDIEFIRNERKSLEACQISDEIIREKIQQKITRYIELEQNMYALQVLAVQLLPR